mgnify:FL=1
MKGVARGLVVKGRSGDTGIPGSRPAGGESSCTGGIPATSLNMSVRRHDSTRRGALDQRLQAAVWRATAVLESLLRPARLHLLKGLYNGA